MAPVSAEFPEPFSEVLARLQDVLELLRDHVATTVAAGPCLAENKAPGARPNTADAPDAAADIPADATHSSSPAPSGSASLAHDAIEAALRTGVQALTACGRAPLALLFPAVNGPLPVLHPPPPGHPPAPPRLLGPARRRGWQPAAPPAGDDRARGAGPRDARPAAPQSVGGRGAAAMRQAGEAGRYYGEEESTLDLMSQGLGGRGVRPCPLNPSDAADE